MKTFQKAGANILMKIECPLKQEVATTPTGIIQSVILLFLIIYRIAIRLFDLNQLFDKYSLFDVYTKEYFITYEGFNQIISILFRFDIPILCHTFLSEKIFELLTKVFNLNNYIRKKKLKFIKKISSKELKFFSARKKPSYR
jgi:hypothetical protein